MNKPVTDKSLLVLDLGRTRYVSTWQLQKRLVDLRASSEIPDCLVITEHEPVLTMGRGTDRQNLLASSDELDRRGVDLHEIERGGDITFHGPGQAVLYPIIDLRRRGRDVRLFLRDLEQLVIETVAELGLDAGVKDGLTGIWVDDKKIGAIGVAVSRWVTYHGVAINVSTDLDYFNLINPCGITEYPVASLSGLLDRDVDLSQFNELLLRHAVNHFGYDPENVIRRTGPADPAEIVRLV